MEKKSIKTPQPNNRLKIVFLAETLFAKKSVKRIEQIFQNEILDVLVRLVFFSRKNRQI